MTHTYIRTHEWTDFVSFLIPAHPKRSHVFDDCRHISILLSKKLSTDNSYVRTVSGDDIGLSTGNQSSAKNFFEHISVSIYVGKSLLVFTHKFSSQ